MGLFWFNFKVVKGKNKGSIKYLSQKQQPSNVGDPDLFGGTIGKARQFTKGALGDVIVPIDNKLLNIAAKYAFRKEFTPTNYKKKFKKFNCWKKGRFIERRWYNRHGSSIYCSDFYRSTMTRKLYKYYKI